MSAPDTPAERLTGTEERPIERIPDDRSSLVDWIVLGAGPAIWITHFMAVYLAAEVICASLRFDEWRFLGADALVVFTVAATLLAMAACAFMAVVARRRAQGGSETSVGVATIGVLLAVGSFVGVLAVGVPALVLDPVC